MTTITQTATVPLVVDLYENIGLSPAWNILPAMFQELADNHCGETYASYPRWDMPCLVARGIGSRSLLGFIAYTDLPEKGIWWLQLAYVAPGFRQRGVFSKLYSTLVERATLRGDILAIELATHEKNSAAHAAYEGAGMQLMARMYRHDLMPCQVPVDTLELQD